ncbi:hypothetical protein AAFF_G00008150 [Aldrovandia affinis]|uniref:Uncharacterized protein n=1 Tax=Aldrovandia affinis TaxID=143900 RepID=A0AAD7T780_9TELE|nr:hypothetical protein AAFF_G00008150 [Aldrovandia affinis]
MTEQGKRRINQPQCDRTGEKTKLTERADSVGEGNRQRLDTSFGNRRYTFASRSLSPRIVSSKNTREEEIEL